MQNRISVPENFKNYQKMSKNNLNLKFGEKIENSMMFPIKIISKTNNHVTVFEIIENRQQIFRFQENSER